jgi:small subunit ribosomal protein S16
MQPKGRFVENVGSYDPEKTKDSLLVDWERIDHWIQKGANPSETVKRLLKKGRPAAT